MNDRTCSNFTEVYLYVQCIWIIGLLRVTVYVVIEDYYFIY